jgi:hypothetical protein
MDHAMMTSAKKVAAFAFLPAALALSACESASRFAGGDGEAPRPVVSSTGPEPGLAAPTAPVSAEPLPPLSGEATASGDPSMSEPLTDDDAMATAPLNAPSSPAAVAAAPAQRAPSPRALAGKWRITDQRGGCAISLTQQSLLDLYRASPAGCQSGSLAKVNAWQQRGQEIVLLEPGGRTAVRLFPKGDGTYEGAATTSGAIVRMAR